MTKTFYTYVHLRPDGSPFYVGKGSTRKRSHDFNHHSRNQLHRNLINKFGRENVGVAAYNCQDEEHAFKLERELITMFRDWGHELANFTDGGHGCAGYKFTPEQKTKQAQLTKAWLAVPENRALQAARIKAAQSRPEVRARMSAAQLATWNDERRVSHSAIIQATFSDDPKYAEYNARRKEWHNSPEEKKRRSESAKKQWADRRAERVEAIKTGAKTRGAEALENMYGEVARAKRSVAMKSEKNRAISSARARASLHSPEVRAKQGATMKTLKWVNDGMQRKRVVDPETYLAKGWVLGRSFKAP